MKDALSLVGLEEGQIVGDRYRIEKGLGAGGMGVVVSARHLLLDERVAMKLLLPALLDNQEAVARFSREARAAVKIKSEHIARVSDVGTLSTGIPYLVMEYLEGGDLAAWVKQKGPLPVEQAVEFVLQACDALGEAHGLGITHRDLKPANLFVVRRADGLWSVKVLDFGISKSAGGMAMTRTAAVMGSPFYMSPEQMESSRGVDNRTDIWSLGVVLYELLTASVPYAGNSIPEVCLKIVAQAPAPIRERRAGIPLGLESVILKCLEKDREKRYRNVAELAQALVPFAPPRARASVDRVVRLVQAASGSTSQADLSPIGDPGEHPKGWGFQGASSASQPPVEPEGSTQGSWWTPATTQSRGKRAAVIGGAAIAAALLATVVLRFVGDDVAELPSSNRASSASAQAPPPVNPAPTAAELPVQAPVPPTASAAPPEVRPPLPPAPSSASATAKDSRPPAAPPRPPVRPKAPPQGTSHPPPVSPTGNVFDNRKW